MKRWLLLLPAAAMLAAESSSPAEYTGRMEQWRREREQRLKADDGWLTVSGLFWLREGENRIGSDPGFEVALPRADGKGVLGTLVMERGKVRLRPAQGGGLLVNGKAATEQQLRSDKDGEPDSVTHGAMTLFVIERGKRVGVRLKDKESAYRRNFTGLRWYPVKPAWKVEARFVPFPKPQKLTMDSTIGEKQEAESPGYAVFERDGKEYRLTPSQEGDQLFFVFRDATAGKTTYKASRFLYTPLAKDGKVTLDFNKAYNPPCVFTPFATCPLPIPENRLKVAVDAGELAYGH